MNGTNMHASANSEEYKLRDILAILARWRKLALVAFLAVLIPGILVTLLMPPMYEASALLLVDRPAMSAGFSVKPGQNLESSSILRSVNREEEVKTVAETIRTRALVETTVDKLSIDTEVLKRIRDFRRYVQGAIDFVLDGIKTVLNELKYLIGFSKRPTAEEEAFASREKLLEAVGERVRVLPVPDTNVLRVAFRASDAALAQSAINTIVTEFVNGNQRSAQASRKHFAEEMRAEAEQLNAADQALADLRSKAATYSSNTQRDLMLQSQERLRVEIAQAEALRAQKAAAIDTLRKRQWTDPRLQAEVSKNLMQAEVELAQVSAQLVSLRGSMDENRRRLAANNTDSVKLRELERAVATAEEAFALRQRNFEQARATESMTGANLRNVRIVDLASYPLSPVRPRTLLYLGVALGAALLAAIALPFLAHLNDTALASEQDVSRLLDLPLVVSVPLIADLAAPPEQPASS